MKRYNELGVGTLNVDRIIGGSQNPGKGTDYWLDPTNGNDSNDGKQPERAFKTFAIAYAALTAGQHDRLFYIAGSSSISLAAGITWAKDYTHFIGVGAPVGVGNRARFFCSAAVATQVTFSASGCIFSNLSFFNGFDDASALGCGLVTGKRNYFDNVRFAGIGHNTQDAANAYSLELNAAEENVFKNCVIGLDTIDRGAATNSEIRLDAGASRNTFEDCFIYALTGANTHVLVLVVDAAGVDRYTRFKNCEFMSLSGSNAIPMLSAFTLPTSMATAYITLDNRCTAVDIVDWEVNNRGKLYTASPDAGTAGTGCGISQVV